MFALRHVTVPRITRVPWWATALSPRPRSASSVVLGPPFACCPATSVPLDPRERTRPRPNPLLNTTRREGIRGGAGFTPRIPQAWVSPCPSPASRDGTGAGVPAAAPGASSGRWVATAARRGRADGGERHRRPPHRSARGTGPAAASLRSGAACARPPVPVPAGEGRGELPAGRWKTLALSRVPSAFPRSMKQSGTPLRVPGKVLVFVRAGDRFLGTASKRLPASAGAQASSVGAGRILPVWMPGAPLLLDGAKGGHPSPAPARLPQGGELTPKTEPWRAAIPCVPLLKRTHLRSFT